MLSRTRVLGVFDALLQSADALYVRELPVGSAVAPADVRRLLADFESGALPRHFASAAAPPGDADPDAPRVVAVVASTFVRLVCAAGTDVLLELWEAGCIPCARTKPTVAALADLFAGGAPATGGAAAAAPRVVVAAMECGENDRDRKAMPAMSFPVFYYFTPGRCGAPRLWERPAEKPKSEVASVSELYSFVRGAASAPLDDAALSLRVPPLEAAARARSDALVAELTRRFVAAAAAKEPPPTPEVLPGIVAQVMRTKA
jgi:hypothetical protein